MKNKLLIIILILVSSSFVQAQTYVDGDYRTTTGGATWDGLFGSGGIVWEKYNGTIWEPATYPTSIDKTVYILNNVTGVFSANITVNPGGKIIISPNKSLSTGSKLTNNAGVGGIVIKADVTGAGVGQFKSNITTNATQEIYLSGSKWHFIGSPFTGINTETTFVGCYMQQFNDADLDNWIWNDEVGFDTSMDQGYGYTYFKSSDETYSLTGSASGGDVTLTNIQHLGDGYVLLANPYTSAVTYNNTWVRTNLDANIWIWEGIGSFGAYNDAKPYNIPTGQAFWMHTTATAQLNIESDNRNVAVTSNPLKRDSEELWEFARLRIQNTINEYADEIQFEFDNRATINYDGQTDASKMYGSEVSPDLFMLTGDDVAVSIKGMEDTQVSTIRMHLRPNVDATYRITATDFTFDPTTEILLEDLFTETIMPVNANLDYTFTSQATDDESRFVIYVRPAATGIDNPVIESLFNIFGSQNHLRILTSEVNYKLSVYNLLGQKLVEKSNLEGNASIDLSAFNQSIVLVSIQSENELVSKKILLK